MPHYLDCAGDVLLIRRVLEIEERLAALELRAKSQELLLFAQHT